MTKVSIDTTKLGRKEPTKVDVNVKNIKKSLAFRGSIFDLDKLTKKFEGAEDVQNDTFGYLSADNERMAKELDLTLDFLKDILELNTKEIKALESLDWGQISAISGEINGKIMNPINEEGVEEGTPSKS